MFYSESNLLFLSIQTCENHPGSKFEIPLNRVIFKEGKTYIFLTTGREQICLILERALHRRKLNGQWDTPARRKVSCRALSCPRPRPHADDLAPDLTRPSKSQQLPLSHHPNLHLATFLHSAGWPSPGLALRPARKHPCRAHLKPASSRKLKKREKEKQPYLILITIPI